MHHGYILTILLCMLTKIIVGTHMRACVCVCVCVRMCMWRERVALQWFCVDPARSSFSHPVNVATQRALLAFLESNT